MHKILIIAAKELTTTFRQRNLLLIMLLTPIVLSTIMGLAFAGLGGDSPDLADIGVAVVNQDQGFNPSDLPSGQISDGDISLNFGSRLAAILLSQSLTATTIISANSGGFNLSELSCPLLATTEAADDDNFTGSLDDLLDAVAVTDPAVARAGVTRGDYAAAVIIPPNFSNQLAPSLGLSAAAVSTATGMVEVVTNDGTPIAASIVRAVVEGIVGQFERVSVALSALILTTIDMASDLDPNQIDVSALYAGRIISTLQSVDASVLEPLACLWTPGAGNVQLRQQPLDEVQERSTFGILMVVLGGAQAVFFALFTGVFGINSIYEERQQGTLQRLLVSPTPGASILAGKLLGNLVVVMAQLLILLFALTAVTSVVEWEWTFIWGTNILALLLVVLGLSLFTTGLGVLVVGLARTPEQVQLIGPLIMMVLGALGGSFGFSLPRRVAQLSPNWWGIDAMRKLAANESDIHLHLLVLFSAGILFAGVGAFFFRRRLEL
jgi:ABC-2 type transport system permease protein